jgi:hypothetical protein
VRVCQYQKPPLWFVLWLEYGDRKILLHRQCLLKLRDRVVCQNMTFHTGRVVGKIGAFEQSHMPATIQLYCRALRDLPCSFCFSS